MSNNIQVPEKFYIYLNAGYIEILKEDARRFEVLKSDNTVNLNTFVNKLIYGYYEQYTNVQSKQKQEILNILETLNISEEEKKCVYAALLQKMSISKRAPLIANKNERLIIRPNKEYLLIYSKILSQKSIPESMSDCFEDIIASYCNLPMSEREKVIFKDTYDKLVNLLEANYKTRITLYTIGSVNSFHEVIPYQMVVNKEEMFNYLLCAKIDSSTGEQSPIAFHLYKLKNINSVTGDTTIDVAIKNHLDEMIKFGPQYIIYENVESCVRLTDKGVISFNQIHFGRPIRDEKKDEYKEDGYYYYFVCSKYQLFTYFRRFGCEAEILYPEDLRNEMKDFFNNASAAYMKG